MKKPVTSKIKKVTNPLVIIKKAMEKQGKYLISKTNNILTLTRMCNGKPMSYRIIKTKNKTLLDLDLNYSFTSTISHFDYAKGEQRLCRNKTIIINVLKDLKKAEVWYLIDKSFLMINSRIIKELSDILI